MKKYLLVIFILLQIHIAYAQESFGIRLGPSFTTLGGEYGGDGSKFRLGLHGGVYYNVFFNRNVSFELGLQYATKGANSDEDGSLTLRNDYLDIPLLLRYHIGNAYLIGGIQPSVMLSSYIIINDNGNKVTLDGRDVKELWQTLDLPIVIGVGTLLPREFNIQLTYEHGFVNISEVSSQVFNRGLKLSLGKNF